MHPSRRFLICLGAGTLVGVVLPAVVFAIGWIIDRVRGDELLAEVLGFLIWCPLVGVSMGVAFWILRYSIAGRILGDVSDVYAPRRKTPVDATTRRGMRIVRWVLFWIVFGAGFGVLAASLVITVVLPVVVVMEGSRGFMQSVESQGFLWGLWSTAVNIWSTLLLEINTGLLSALAEPLVFGALVGPFLWALLLLALRRVNAAR